MSSDKDMQQAGTLIFEEERVIGTLLDRDGEPIAFGQVIQKITIQARHDSQGIEVLDFQCKVFHRMKTGTVYQEASMAFTISVMTMKEIFDKSLGTIIGRVSRDVLKLDGHYMQMLSNLMPHFHVLKRIDDENGMDTFLEECMGLWDKTQQGELLKLDSKQGREILRSMALISRIQLNEHMPTT